MGKKITSASIKNDILNACNELPERIKQTKQDTPIALQEKKSRKEAMDIVHDISHERIFQ